MRFVSKSHAATYVLLAMAALILSGCYFPYN